MQNTKKEKRSKKERNAEACGNCRSRGNRQRRPTAIFLDDFHRCLEKAYAKTLRLFPQFPQAQRSNNYQHYPFLYLTDGVHSTNVPDCVLAIADCSRGEGTQTRRKPNLTVRKSSSTPSARHQRGPVA